LSARLETTIFMRMSIEEKVAELLALPERDRALLAQKLIASLDDTRDEGAETEWEQVIDRRSREIKEGKVNCRPVDQVVKDVRHRLHAHRQPS
jgi:putative addiction module component (TIGR02574 family)